VIDQKELMALSRATEQYLKDRGTDENEVEKEMAVVEADLAAAGFRVKLSVKTGIPFTEIMAAQNLSRIGDGATVGRPVILERVSLPQCAI
jgi:hypothetical protein